MKKFLIAALASLAFMPMAQAGEVEGVIAAINQEDGSIKLESGQVFTASEDVDLQGLSQGVKVRIVFEDGSETATAVERL